MAPTRPKTISQHDKLRAISNLQSEITRRARSLRAEYARAAQSLRSKLEMRIYRIPKALRKANMGELLQKYIQMQDEDGKPVLKAKSTLQDSVRPMPAAATKLSPAKPIVTKTTNTRTKAAPAQTQTVEAKPSRAANSTRTRGVKRNSEIMIAADNMTDKENEAIENPKKRSKTGANTAPTRSMRDPNTILSPKSNNSRTLPQSPVRNPLGVPPKGFASRPASPLKSGLPSPVRQPTVTRPATAASNARGAASRATKATTASTRAAPARGAAKTAANRTASAASTASNTTTATTIVRKGATGRAGTAASAAKKTTATAGTAASARRTAATKAKADAPSETGTRRVLRKRG